MFSIGKMLYILIPGIFLLHSLIPHQHHGDMTVTEHKLAHEYANNVIDYLGLFFHEGSTNNTEAIVLVKEIIKKKVESNKGVYFANFNISKKELFPKHFPNPTQLNTSIFWNSFQIKSRGLRAPPTWKNLPRISKTITNFYKKPK
jgi:hypothetical protein